MLTRDTGVSHEIALREEQVSDVSLATFYVFGKENPGTFRPGVRLAVGAGGGCWTGTYYTSRPEMMIIGRRLVRKGQRTGMR